MFKYFVKRRFTFEYYIMLIATRQKCVNQKLMPQVLMVLAVLMKIDLSFFLSFFFTKAPLQRNLLRECPIHWFRDLMPRAYSPDSKVESNEYVILPGHGRAEVNEMDWEWITINCPSLSRFDVH